jgi:hypothetical protein
VELVLRLAVDSQARERFRVHRGADPQARGRDPLVSPAVVVRRRALRVPVGGIISVERSRPIEADRRTRVTGTVPTVEIMEHGTRRQCGRIPVPTVDIGQRRPPAGVPAADPMVGAVVVDTLALRTRALRTRAVVVDSMVAAVVDRTAVVVDRTAVVVDRTADAANLRRVRPES